MIAALIPIFFIASIIVVLLIIANFQHSEDLKRREEWDREYKERKH